MAFFFHKNHEDYACVKGEYQSILKKKKKSLFEMWKYGIIILWDINLRKYIHTNVVRNSFLHHVKPTNPLSFQTEFPKSRPTYRREGVNPWHQTPQG